MPKTKFVDFNAVKAAILLPQDVCAFKLAQVCLLKLPEQDPDCRSRCNLPPGTQGPGLPKHRQKVVIGEGEIDMTFTYLPSSEDMTKSQQRLRGMGR